MEDIRQPAYKTMTKEAILMYLAYYKKIMVSNATYIDTMSGEIKGSEAKKFLVDEATYETVFWNGVLIVAIPPEQMTKELTMLLFANNELIRKRR